MLKRDSTLAPASVLFSLCSSRMSLLPQQKHRHFPAVLLEFCRFIRSQPVLCMKFAPRPVQRGISPLRPYCWLKLLLQHPFYGSARSHRSIRPAWPGWGWTRHAACSHRRVMIRKAWPRWRWHCAAAWPGWRNVGRCPAWPRGGWRWRPKPAAVPGFCSAMSRPARQMIQPPLPPAG